MKFFYLSTLKNPDGFYEIHERECDLIPDMLEREYLGPFNNHKEALTRALTKKANVRPCLSCCKKQVYTLLKVS
ncbi:hypothetical protein [Pararhodonellum marinum]|uniref:hypothetical protein n=1 Tax=Pararhodonellum marinum TaxID=2755358 RepID=UPI00188FE733|nr:hypothetical protein [Pararhodonellum marinum]